MVFDTVFPSCFFQSTADSFSLSIVSPDDFAAHLPEAY